MYTIVSVLILEISYILTTNLHYNIKKKSYELLGAIIKTWVGGRGEEGWARALPYMPKYSLNDHK
jgi:hypothetical protein